MNLSIDSGISCLSQVEVATKPQQNCEGVRFNLQRWGVFPGFSLEFFYSIPVPVRFLQFRQLLWYLWQVGDISNSQPPELASEIGGFLQLHQRETQHRKTTRISNCQSTIERGSQGHCAVSHARIPAQNAKELMAMSRDQGNTRQKIMNQNMSFWKRVKLSSPFKHIQIL